MTMVGAWKSEHHAHVEILGGMFKWTLEKVYVKISGEGLGSPGNWKPELVFVRNPNMRIWGSRQPRPIYSTAETPRETAFSQINVSTENTILG